MSDLQEILKSVTESVQVIQDMDFRKIAFQELLRHALESTSHAANPTSVLQSPNRARAAKRVPSAAKADRASGVRPEVSKLELSPDEPSLVAWGTLTADWKKFCWILEGARLKGIDGLTNSEISYLIDKIFRENYKPELVNNLKVQIKKGMVKSVLVKSGDREYRVWKILAGGIKELAAKSGSE